VTECGQDWSDRERVDRWVARDAGRPAVQAARELAVALIALERSPALVVELAAGAGSFLAAFLATFPQARGVWSDSSAAMAPHARTALSPFGDRVGYVLSDMRRPGIAMTGVADVVVCARATYGLGAVDLAAFYALAARILRPGGWLVNLDHTAVPEQWAARYDAVTPRFYGGSTSGGRKDRGGHSVVAHLDAVGSAGLTDAEIPWRLLSTVLLLARRPAAGT
jgi:SAM-dependent methyltransferase